MPPEITASQLFHRQTGFFNPEEHPGAHITFIGVGGIGSFAAFACAKLGVPGITLIDPDIVEVHNAPNQLHALERANEPKVEALASEIATHIGTSATTHVARIGEHGWETEAGLALPSDPNGMVVSGLDSMEARKHLWESKLNMNPSVPFYIDGRIAGELIVLYAFNPHDIDDAQAYEKTLHSDDEAEPASCTERGLIDVGFMVGALIARLIRLRLTGETVPKITYVNEKSLNVMQGDWVEK